MLSSANTDVGLTHDASVEQTRGAEDLLPDGRAELRPRGGERRLPGPCRRDLLQSKAFKLAQGKKFKPVKNVFILHDNQTFGKGVAQAFRHKAKKLGHQGARLRAVGREGDELRGDR